MSKKKIETQYGYGGYGGYGGGGGGGGDGYGGYGGYGGGGYGGGGGGGGDGDGGGYGGYGGGGSSDVPKERRIATPLPEGLCGAYQIADFLLSRGDPAGERILLMVTNPIRSK